MEPYLVPGRNQFLPTAIDLNRDGIPDIILGAGGETIQGNLYALTLADFMVSGTRKSNLIDSAVAKGSIITDLTGDGIGEIVIGSMHGWMKSYNGKGFSLIWSKKIHSSPETQSMPAPVYFDDDKVPDFFNTFNVGQWPDNDTAIHVILSGIDGHELFRDILGIMGLLTSQPSVAKLLAYSIT